MEQCLTRKEYMQACKVACCVWLSVTPWTVACQAPLSMRFSRQESWSGLPRPPPGDLPNPGIKPTSLMTPAGGFFITSTTWEVQEKNELLIKLTPWKDLKTGCTKEAEHKNRTCCLILLHEVLGEAKLVHSRRNRNKGNHSARGGGLAGKGCEPSFWGWKHSMFGKGVGYTDVWICHWTLYF